jgi:hypothetical protein
LVWTGAGAGFAFSTGLAVTVSFLSADVDRAVLEVLRAVELVALVGDGVVLIGAAFVLSLPTVMVAEEGGVAVTETGACALNLPIDVVGVDDFTGAV